MLSAAYFGSGNLNFVTPLRLSKVYARKKKKKDIEYTLALSLSYLA